MLTRSQRLDAIRIAENTEALADIRREYEERLSDLRATLALREGRIAELTGKLAAALEL